MSDVEYLTDELKRLVGHGAKPHRLPTFPTLRQFAEQDQAPSFAAAGYAMQHWLRREIEALEGVYDFSWGWQKRQVPAELLRRLYGLLLGFEASSKDVTNRRERVIILLKLTGCSVETWRRPFGPERDLLRLLASSIASRTESSPNLGQAS